ncbi:hypothetical protein C4F40_04275 [Sphingobacterium sp. Ka21]|uniref:HTH LytTR-type domain-containing protein n=2 Tax=Sphingobacterium pedocola TaxID=2082722 RepID=A0ABR9T3N4_9SPHI|nr:hypothetical protein [Sphingobacterium pedocola]
MYVCIAIAIFSAFIPVIQSLSGELHDKFLRDRISYALMAGLIFSIIACTATYFTMYPIYLKRPPRKQALAFWAFAPYTLIILFLTYAFAQFANMDLTDLSDRNEHPFIRIDPDIERLTIQADLNYFIVAALIGYALLFIYKGFRKHFTLIAMDFLPAQSSTPQAAKPVELSDHSTDTLLDEAQKLASTFANPKPVDPNAPTVEIDFYAFVYGEGFDYVVFNEGFTTPFLFDEDDTIDTLHEGMYLHINKALYIRFDQIMMIDLEQRYIVIAPPLMKIFKAVNHEGVKKKIASYRYPGKPNGYYRIDPTLIAKLKKKIERISS